MPHTARWWNSTWLRALLVAVALILLGLSGPLGFYDRVPSPIALAGADAGRQARHAQRVADEGVPHVWTAEQLGRQASTLPGVEVMSVSGASIAHAYGVRLVIRVIGHAQAGKVVTEVPSCFQLRFGRLYRRAVAATPCPDGTPLRYPPLPPAPTLPALRDLEARVTTALAATDPSTPLTGRLRATALSTVVPGLDLALGVRVGISAHADAAGLALDAYDPATYTYSCVLVQAAVAGVFAWQVVPAAPGQDPRCTGYAAAAGLGRPGAPAPLPLPLLPGTTWRAAP